ncbi:bifunctional diguanylate cyclase/phosphodiesterase [Aurantimonas sp. VKM B-3413]|uniref:putative bifunctional diguanylate cyclase/phosphodiesterase n=1 Tax=Aurantimonas sp. VKM B-3413 TaxID=2779401 RepID=UPI001E303CC4|nr:EAL domain-containing protein [Aurantimonas sp. VKM B-3413]MCB8838829.1 EAL domain-containing protein [Aurantimonas sp. VKM B-3413]
MTEYGATDPAEDMDDEAVVRSLFGDLPSFTLGAISALAGAVLTGFYSDTLWVWIAVAAVTLVRFATMASFLKRAGRGSLDTRYWRQVYAIVGTAHVLVLGCWALSIFWSADSQFSELMSFAICVGYLVGVQGRNFSSEIIVRLQLIAAAVPMVLALMVKGSLAYAALALFFLLFVLSILRTSQRMNETFSAAVSAARANKKLAETDLLTGLPNRAAMRFIIEEATADRGMPFALHFVDLDRFKHINDSLGHAAGDRMLIEVSRRFTAVAGDRAVVSRFAGDEFVILHRGVGTLAEAEAFAARLIESLATPIELGGIAVVIDCCVGTALYPRDGADAAILTQRADTALFAAKRIGKGHHSAFSTQMAEMEEERLSLETDLRAALARGELGLAFQPMLAPDGTIVTCEALARWTIPGKGAVSPAKFLPVAEEAGLMTLLTDHVFALACETAASWPGNVGVAVNLSPGQLHRIDLVDMVERVCRKAGLPLSRLEIEITEESTVNFDGCVLESLMRLKALGIRLSLDDFGTGYSNLGRIGRLPIDKIKIDRSFVTQIEMDERQHALLKGAIGFIASLGLDIVVEGVETVGQLEMLHREKAVTAIQGFVYGFPLPAQGIAALLAKAEGRTGRNDLEPRLRASTSADARSR